MQVRECGPLACSMASPFLGEMASPRASRVGTQKREIAYLVRRRREARPRQARSEKDYRSRKRLMKNSYY